MRISRCEGQEKVLGMSASKKPGAARLDPYCGEGRGLATEAGICGMGDSSNLNSVFGAFMAEDRINKSAHFIVDNITYQMFCISDEEMKEMRKDPVTGLERTFYGFPMYFTKSGAVYPLPANDKIKVIYG